MYEGTAVTDIVVPDLGYARELFVRAAELNYPASQLRLGCAYEYGTMGCQIDPRKSIFWYSKAAMTGMCQLKDKGCLGVNATRGSGEPARFKRVVSNRSRRRVTAE